MKITDMMNELAALLAKHGDLPVRVMNTERECPSGPVIAYDKDGRNSFDEDCDKPDHVVIH